MSTASGFVVGLVAAASLSLLYGQQLASSVRDAIDRYPLVQDPTPVVAPVIENIAAVAVAEPVVVTPVGTTLEARWAEFVAQAASLAPVGEFPWRECFARAAASHQLPESLLLAVARGESNFDPAARSERDAVGLMQIRWPGTSRHLGIVREADLYDPCTNVDAGARYLVELAARFNGNLHLALAAYNYGPGRISAAQELPEGARWYSQYIYQHLQNVLGLQSPGDSDATRPVPAARARYQVLLRFDREQRARDFMSFIRAQVPGIKLQQRDKALGQHEIVLLYQDDSERLRALSRINAVGIATDHLAPTSENLL